MKQWNMKVSIGDYQFTVVNVICLLRSKNLGVYTLQGMDGEFANFARESLLERSYFNLEINVDNKIILLGTDCFFNNIDVFNGTAKLNVNWVETSLI